MITFPRYKRELSNLLKGNEIYSLGAKKNSFKDETSLFRNMDFSIVLDQFTDEEFENILVHTMVNDTIDPDILQLIKYFRNNKMGYK